MSEEGGHESFFGGTTTGCCEEDKSTGKHNNQQEQQPLQDSTNTKNNNKRGRGGEGGGGVGGESDHEVHILTERERRKKMRNMFSNLHDLLPQLPPKADKSTIVDEAVSYIKTLEKTLQKLQKQKLERQLQGSIDFGHYKEIPVKTTEIQQAFDSSCSREAFMADQVSSSKNNNKNNNYATKIFSINPLSVPQSPLQFQTWTSSNVVLNICGKEAQISVCSSKKQGLFTTICCILEKYKLEVISAHVSSDPNRCMFMIQAHVASTGASNHQLSSEAFEVDEIFKQAAAEIMCWVTF